MDRCSVSDSFTRTPKQCFVYRRPLAVPPTWLRGSESRLLRQIKSYASDIKKYLKFRSLLPVFQMPHLQFLTDDELKLFTHQQKKGVSDSTLANDLLIILDRDCPDSARKFIACLLKEKEHRGHSYLAELLMRKAPSAEIKKIQAILVCRNPITRNDRWLMEPQGSLRSRGFVALDRKLWSYFNASEYTKLSKLTADMKRHQRSTNDLTIVAMWFDSLISMHKDGDHAASISKHLLPALELCRNAENRLILEGRIYQRMGQLYLVQGLQELAVRCIEQADSYLQFVSRGYEKVNMLCRRAKLLSATHTDQRDMIEDLYIKALAAINEDDPFISASRPSIIMSTAAFYLRISFGSKPSAMDLPPYVPKTDIAKAKAILARLPDNEVVHEMRKCELKILTAELSRLEGAPQQVLLHHFGEVLCDAQKLNLYNLVAIAKHRIQSVEQQSPELLVGEKGTEQT